jgi:diguanylate cyclase (GGDEF)-like protein
MSEGNMTTTLSRIPVDDSERRHAENATRRKRVEHMTEEEKVRALLTDELTGLGNRRAWEQADRRPVQAMLDVEGLKWVNDNLGWAAGDELLRAVASALREEGVLGYRLGGDEFVFEGEDRRTIEGAVGRIRKRLLAARIEARLKDGSAWRINGARIHAGIGPSLDHADAALNAAKKAGIAAGQWAERGSRPRGLSETRVTPSEARVPVPSTEDEPPVLRFFLRALREADPDFGEEKDPGTGEDLMSRGWLTRSMR